MDPLYQGLITATVSFLTASSGFWLALRNRTKIAADERRALISLLMGLAQNKIIYLGLKYIERGWVTADEYQDLRRYLYEPYSKLGGNGSVERIMHAVERLPFDESSKSLLERTFREMPIRQTDPTGVPLKNVKPYEGDDRRDRHRRTSRHPGPPAQ